MPTLLGVQVAQVARDVGLSGDTLVLALAIARAESSWRSDVHNSTPPDDSYGLWQINRNAHPQYSPEFLITPEGNAQAMYAISSGGTNWRPWATFNNREYRNHLEPARTAAAGLGSTGVTIGESVPGVPPTPQHTPAPTDSLVAGLSVIGPNTLAIEGEQVTAITTVLSAELVRSVDEPSSLTLRLLDPDRTLLRSNLAKQRSRIQVDGIYFQLADVAKQGNDLQLTFLDTAAAVFIADTGKLLAQAPTAGTRGEFLRRLASEHPEVPVDIETGATTLEELRTEPDESLWQAMGRVARQVGWRRLATANRLLIGSDEWLMSRTQPITIREWTDGVESIDFDYVTGVDVDEATFTCSAPLWAGPPTQAVLVEDCGWADGEWMVAQIRRSLGSTETQVTLTRPSPVLPEPVPSAGDGFDVTDAIGSGALPGVGPQVDTSNTAWAGTQAICEALTVDFAALGLTLSSAKRSRKFTSSGNISDHWEGNAQAYAQDWSNGDSPTPQMDAAAERVMQRLAVPYARGTECDYSGTHTFNGLRVRVEVLWRTSGHFDHVHVGVERR